MTDISTEFPGREASRRDKPLASRFYLAAWRWHFYAGLYVAPFLLMLAVTGLIMLYTMVFDGRDGEKITVEPGQAVAALSLQADAALAAVPGSELVEWIGPMDARGVSVFRVSQGDAQTMVAVDPYRTEVVETWNRQAGWYDFANDIHGSLLIGDLGDRLIEIAAGFGIVLVITGLYMWLPRRGQDWRSVLVPAVFARGRERWKSLHRSVGFYVAILLVAFLISGMSWTGIWGDRFVQAWSTFPAAKWDNVPLSDKTHAAMNHGATKDVPWALEKTPMPESGSEVAIEARSAGMNPDVGAIAALGRDLGLEGRFRINYPAGDAGVWTLSQDSMSFDSTDPMVDRTVHVDRFTGNILADVGFADYSLPGKAMAVGVALHEGTAGWWNVALNTVFCLSVIFLSVSGIVMWWMRRPSQAVRLAAPPRGAEMPLWKGAAIVMVLVSLMFPLVGLTLIVVLALDALVIQRIGPLRRLVS
ncbi:putative iron-regulated membrane protein [Hoeflea marina]|uniref:Putative iron-regulated membrane protein n=1 Tax=Hoeflea marina TaxID=274592 RepID=A0A317PNB4_9HYPH|nr:PepSY domain-containing protein [Hoeflea marina]PWW02043.1 putative iron-regulated membrane protein [Hoeflea marina]